LLVWLLAILATSNAAPALRIIKTANHGNALLNNGSFEDLSEGRPASWFSWQQGFKVAPGQGRAGSQCVVCERRDGDRETGAGQTLALNRTNIAPFIIRGWSKAENVSGSPDSGYSLYVDILYADGTPLWGQTASFSCGTHDWERREFVLLPDKPVKSLTLHGLFRGHTGKVWFDDLSLEEVPTPEGAILFQGVPLGGWSDSQPETKSPPRKYTTSDGLALTTRDNSITSLQINGRDVTSGSPSGLLVRDFAADSDFFAFKSGACSELGLASSTKITAAGDHIAVEGRVTDTTGKDRAITLLFALPLDATGWQWGDDVRRSRRAEGRDEFANTVTLHCGSNGKMSLYPLAAVWSGQAGVALALDMDRPAQYRLVYHAGTKQLFIAYDFALTPETAMFPSSADFKFVLYRFDPRWGFRAALRKYYELFPSQFTKRVSREGVWMPFTDISKVPGFEDFGFAFQEGAPNVAFDDQHGIASFFYVEPMSHWLAMPREAPRTYDGAMAVLKSDLAGGRGKEAREMAAATFTSGIETADGRFLLRLQKAPWCDGGVFTLNPDPHLATTPELPFNKAMVMFLGILSSFRKNQPADRTNSRAAGLDGVYLDSFEMASSALNYRRDHFRTANVPLVFDSQGRPCQLMIFNTWEFARDLSAQMHQRNKLMFANGVLWDFAFPAPLLDVLGTEVHWLHQDRYAPDSDAVMNFRRALCCRKPYCLLMNADYAKFTPDLVERYFQRCLFYGIWPGFFDQEAASKDPYWASTNKWYERDRPFFKKYIPLLRRITAAGWQPVTYASSDNPKILLERFGPDASGTVFLTLLNDTAETQAASITLDFQTLGLKPGVHARALVSNLPASPASNGLRVSLRPQQAEALVLIPDSK
jgi:hypothetical protein